MANQSRRARDATWSFVSVCECAQSRCSRLDRVFTHDTLASTWLSDFTSPTQRLVFLGAFRVAFHADDLLAVFKFSRIEVRVAAVFPAHFRELLPALSSMSASFCVIYHPFCLFTFWNFRISRHVFAFPICVANFVIVYIARERKVTWRVAIKRLHNKQFFLSSCQGYHRV